MEALKKLGNNISYSINQWVTNPEAEAIVAQEEQQKAIEEVKIETAKVEEAKKAEEAAKEEEANKSDSDVFKEIFIKVGVSIIGIAIILLFGSLICNYAIHSWKMIRFKLL